jgi:hypothetical protein
VQQTGTQWNEGLEIMLERARFSLAFPSPLLKNQPATVTLVRGGETSIIPTGWSWAFRHQAEAAKLKF